MLGLIASYVGKDYTHKDIVDFYQKIIKNGYFIVYLSSRTMAMEKQTKSYLNSISQNGVGLPDGPVILSPDRLFFTFKREIVMKNPDVFKIAAMKDLWN